MKIHVRFKLSPDINQLSASQVLIGLAGALRSPVTFRANDRVFEAMFSVSTASRAFDVQEVVKQRFGTECFEFDVRTS